MKTILIYNASWHTFGGGEKYICTLAEILSRTGLYDVTLLIDKPSITKEALRKYFNLALEQVRVQATMARDVPGLLSTADVGVVVSNFKPFGNRARKNVYVLQIPYGVLSLSRTLSRLAKGEIKEAGKDIYRRSLLNDARHADLAIVYSEFVREALHLNHGINAQVLYPAIDDFAESTTKENVILSVGRFFRGLYNDKRYDFMIEAFKKLRERLPNTSWTYHLVGSCGSDFESQRYLEELRAVATGHPIYFHVNSSYVELRRCYSQSEIFWHAAGYEVDEERHPERTEHFGMSTVEAMSAGCVPVVANKGGQKEIVSHGKSGYLWNTLDELLEHTASLINNPGQGSAMRHSARQRFRDFDHQHFSSKLISLFKQLDKY
jgi:glycosyltransferase involved in cell wall biosynthesis